MAKSLSYVPKEIGLALGQNYLTPEGRKTSELARLLDWTTDQAQSTSKRAEYLVTKIRNNHSATKLIDAFLQEYGLSTDEGVVLMRLAESLIRTPDKATAFALIRDKIDTGDWASHAGDSTSPLVDLATFGLGLTKSWIRISGGKTASHLAAKLGDHTLYLAIFRVMQMMGDHYVLGKDIGSAITRALKEAGPQDCYSFDMLGEAAHTHQDAERYFEAYQLALESIAKKQGKSGFRAGQAGLSVKLSALHPRYEFAQQDRCVPALIEKLTQLGVFAKTHGLNITIDAEEAERLEISLMVLSGLTRVEALQGWNGFGFVVQAYQRRALPLIDYLIDLFRDQNSILNIRLVKGAYWDSEIKRAQEMGLESYPVFTRKENTDLSYLTCAKKLLAAPDAVYPCFATHNAHTAAAILTLAGENQNFEFQRLHGMGRDLHEELKSLSTQASRVYAPVGKHEDLLPYLVRRLLENGANSSFVNQLTSDEVSLEEIITDPIATVDANTEAAHPNIHAPQDHFAGDRLAAKGIDLTQSVTADHIQRIYSKYKPIKAHALIGGKKPKTSLGTHPVYSPARHTETVGQYLACDIKAVDDAIIAAQNSSWTQYSPEQRKAAIIKLGDLLTEQYDHFLALCVKEAGKSWADAVAEVREAIDFCYYYAGQIEDRDALGVVACISPWNFPLAIFLGQVIGALAGGNRVICKPAEQTPLIAFEAIKLLFKAGIPKDAVHLVLGDGRVLGTHLSAHPDIDGICFTGSTATAKKILEQLVNTKRASIPLIAETGGINAMVVDSTALLEQVVTDVISSAFQSAGQRCSACRIVCVQDEIADDFIDMLSGAMDALNISHPENLSTDVGPVIDHAALNMLQAYITEAKSNFKTFHEAPLGADVKTGHFIAPIAFEIPNLSVMKREIFGPVLHVYRFKSEAFETVVNDINSLGYGLTMGLHTRIDSRVAQVSDMAKIGNLYVNRNQIGAVVGVQPFGGEGLSGTGPKAGGPNYVKRLSKPKGRLIKPAVPSAEDLSASKPDNAIDLVEFSKHAKAWAENIDMRSVEQLINMFARNFYEIETHLLSDIRNVPQEEIILPGPTGETNHLKRCARGMIYCDGTLADSALCKAVLYALSSGNIIFLSLPDTGRSERWLGFAKALNGEIGYRLIWITMGNPFDVQNISELGAIITAPENINAWTKWVLLQGAQIVPVLTEYDERERYYIERTVTINTTAAGGNATLLAM